MGEKEEILPFKVINVINVFSLEGRGEEGRGDHRTGGQGRGRRLPGHGYERPETEDAGRHGGQGGAHGTEGRSDHRRGKGVHWEAR